MGVSEKILAFGAQTHGNDVHGTQQIEHGEQNNGEYFFFFTINHNITYCNYTVKIKNKKKKTIIYQI